MTKADAMGVQERGGNAMEGRKSPCQGAGARKIVNHILAYYPSIV